MDIVERETAKYEAMWALPEYHKRSPGGDWVEKFIDIAKPKRGETVVDLGCGAGAAMDGLEGAGLEVTGLDLADFREDKAFCFIRSSLWGRWRGLKGRKFNYGYCCDVMEHIPLDYVTLALERIRANCRHAFFSVASMEDSCGAMIGEPLHLTIMPFEWWKTKMAEIGELIEARDLLYENLFYVRCAK